MYSFQSIRAIVLFCLLTSWSYGQNDLVHDRLPAQKQEDILKSRMMADGVSSTMADRLLEQRRLLLDRNATVSSSGTYQESAAAASCNDMGAENGWGYWRGATGDCMSGAAAYSPLSGSMQAPYFLTTSGSGADQCSMASGAPNIPFVAPGFGNHSIRLGEPQVPGYGAEKASFSFVVSPADTDFIYMYALVIQDAGHSVSEQPYVSLCIKDEDGSPIPCGCFRYTGGPNLPGFFPSQCGRNTFYKPWTIVGVDLAGYIGQTVTVDIENVDCAQGGHYAYSYWDFSCGILLNDGGFYCTGQQAELCVSPDPSNTYQYQWYQNGQPYSGAGGSSSCISPYPNPGDTFAVKVSPPGGCSFDLVYVPEKFVLRAEFTDSVHCGKVFFGDQSSNSIAALGIDSWQWAFPTGSPAFSNSDDPGEIMFGVGQHTATLVISKNQCVDSIEHTFEVDPLPIADFGTFSSCEGTPSLFDNNTFSPARDPVVDYRWYFPDGIPRTSNAYLPSSRFDQHGNTDVTLVVTTQDGCVDSIRKQVLIHELPVVAFSPPVVGCAPFDAQLANLTTTSMDTVDRWLWSFPGGTPERSTDRVPPAVSYPGPGIYEVNLSAITRNGCAAQSGSASQVKVLPSPAADFSVRDLSLTLDDPSTSFLQYSSPDAWFWEWDFGDGTKDSLDKNPRHSYAEAAPLNQRYEFDVTLWVSNYHGCKDSVKKKIEVLPVSRFYVPNAFTPNGDDVNDRFYAKCLGVKHYTIHLYDRWGRMIWGCEEEGDNALYDGTLEGLSAQCQWDGHVYYDGDSPKKGDPSQGDVYVYKVKYTDLFDRNHELVGNVTVVY